MRDLCIKELETLSAVLLDSELCIGSFSPAAARQFGLDTTHIGKSLTVLEPELFETEGDDGSAPDLHALAVECAGGRAIARGVCDKSGRWFSLHMHRCGSDGKPGVLMIVADVDELKTEDQSAAYMAAIVMHSDDAIISKDLNGIIHSWNKAAERLYGYTAEEAIGQPVSILIPPGHDDEEPEILARLRRGELIDHYETVRMHKDGRLIDISLTVSPVKDASGKFVGAAKIARDISDAKQMRDSLQSKNEELARFNDVAVGRELRMVELKKEMNELCRRLGEPERFPLDF